MTSWVSYFLKKCLSIIALVSIGLTLFSSDPAHALGVEVTQARIESSDEGHLLSQSVIILNSVMKFVMLLRMAYLCISSMKWKWCVHVGIGLVKNLKQAK